jgi:hypothetical protein
MNPKQHKFIIDDIAAASLQSAEKVRRDVRAGKLAPDDLWCLCKYIVRNRLERMT